MKEENKHQTLYPHEYEQASNSYLMAVVAVIAGLPLPIINLIAAVGFYLGHRKSTYFVRWHCIQSIIGQALVIPFNSIAFAWTIGVFINLKNRSYHSDREFGEAFTDNTYTAYWIYILFVVVLNLFEFITVLYTATRVRKGHNVRWAGIATITDKLTSKENRDPYSTTA